MGMLESDFNEVKFVHGSKKPKVGDIVLIRPPKGMRVILPKEVVDNVRTTLEDPPVYENLRRPRSERYRGPDLRDDVELYVFNGIESWEALVVAKTVTDTLDGDREIVYTCEHTLGQDE